MNSPKSMQLLAVLLENFQREPGETISLSEDLRTGIQDGNHRLEAVAMASCNCPGENCFSCAKGR